MFVCVTGDHHAAKILIMSALGSIAYPTQDLRGQNKDDTDREILRMALVNLPRSSDVSLVATPALYIDIREGLDCFV